MSSVLAVSQLLVRQEYDVCVCGTGLKECILSGLLSVHGKKVSWHARRGRISFAGPELQAFACFRCVIGPHNEVAEVSARAREAWEAGRPKRRLRAKTAPPPPSS